MSLEQFQIQYLRSSRLYPFLGVPYFGALAQQYLAWSTLRRTLRLQRAEAALKVRAEALEAQRRAAHAHSQA